MEKTRLRSAKVRTPAGPFVQGVKAGNMVFVSGQVARGSDGNVVGTDARTQTQQVMENMKAVLAEAGGDLTDVVKITVFLKHIEDYPAVWEVRREYFGESLPASTLVAVKELIHPDFLVEIEAIAIV